MFGAEVFTLQHTAVTWRVLLPEGLHSEPDLAKTLCKKKYHKNENHHVTKTKVLQAKIRGSKSRVSKKDGLLQSSYSIYKNNELRTSE